MPTAPRVQPPGAPGSATGSNAQPLGSAYAPKDNGHTRWIVAGVVVIVVIVITAAVILSGLGSSGGLSDAEWTYCFSSAPAYDVDNAAEALGIQFVVDASGDLVPPWEARHGYPQAAQWRTDPDYIRACKAEFGAAHGN